jgi:hypothetical protein
MDTPRLRDIPDDAPCTAFAPCPVSAYNRGLEDRRYDGCYFNPYRRGSAEWWEYEAGQRDAAREAMGRAL